MVIKMSDRLNELIEIVYAYEEDYWRRHPDSPRMYLKEFIYDDAPQEIIDAYEEMRSIEICDNYMQ